MRRRVGTLLVVASVLLSVALGVAVNVATAGGRGAVWAWLAVGLCAVVAAGLAVWQYRLSPGSAPVAAVVLRPAELPAAPSFVGRGRDLASARELIEGGCRVLAVFGEGGAGKSAFGYRLAHELRERFPDGQLYAALRGASADPVRPELVLARFLAALGRPEDERLGEVEVLAARFRSVVADRRVLVLLDDARDGAQVRPLLPGGAGCLTLVISRRQVADLPGAAALVLGGMPADEGFELLAVTAGRERVAADPAGARRVVAACAGLPLAVRLAGARLRARPGWSPSVLADRLDDEGRRLDELRVGARAVRSVFAAAYAELPEADRVVFRRAGAHPGPWFAVSAAAARCGLPAAEVAGPLERLADVFLVEEPAPGRFRLHDLLRLFARDLLAADERVGCLARQVAWMSGQPVDRENVVPVLRAAVADGLAGPARVLVESVHPQLTRSDDHLVRLPLWQAGLAAADALGDDLLRVRALRWVSHSYGLAGDVRRELPAAREALAVAERLGDPSETAHSVRRLGEALRAHERHPEAENMLMRALELFVAAGDVEEEIEVRSALGTLYNTLWRPRESLPVLERARELLPPVEVPVHGWVLSGLSLAYKFLGRRDEAVALNERAFGVARRLGDDYLLGYCLQERAYLAEQDGRWADAERDFREMLAIFTRTGHGMGVGGAYGGLALIAERRGDLPAALGSYDAGIGEYERLGLAVREGELRLHRAAVLRELGRADEAAAERVRAEGLIGDSPVHLGPGLLERLPALTPRFHERA